MQQQPVRPSPATPLVIPLIASPIAKPTFSTAQTTPATGTPRNLSISNIAKGVNGALQSTPGQIVTDTAGAMSGAAVKVLVPNSRALNALGNANTVAPVVSGAVTNGTLGAVTAGTKQVLVNGAGAAGAAVVGGAGVAAAGGAAVAAGTATASFDVGQKYVAPRVAPAIGSAMYKAAPQLFTPSTVKPSVAPKKVH